MAKRGTAALHGSGEQAAPEVRLRACDLTGYGNANDSFAALVREREPFDRSPIP